MDLHSKVTMYVTSTMTRPVIKTTKMSKWFKLKFQKNRCSTTALVSKDCNGVVGSPSPGNAKCRITFLKKNS